MTRASPFWSRGAYADRQPFLRKRRAMTEAVRRFFASEGFEEVETAALQVSGGNEPHISTFGVELLGASGDKSRLFLHSSPEFACKKLLAAGEERIFTFARVFRNRERGPLHHPEFTMLEWYRAGEPLSRVVEDCAGLMVAAARAAATDSFLWRDGMADAFEEPEVLTLCEAFDRHAGDRPRAPSRRSRGSRSRRRPAGGARRRRRQLVRSFQQDPLREDRAASRIRPSDDPHRLPRERSGLGARESPRTRAFASASSSICAASRSPMALAS